MKAVIDIETGGFSVKNSAIVEIGLIIVNDENESVSEYRSLIKPYHQYNSIELMEYSDDAEKLHGYSIEQLRKEGEEPEFVCAEIDVILDLYDVSEFIGHNIDSFDLPRLAHFWDRFSLVQSGQGRFQSTVDTLKNSKRLLNANSYSLENLCRSLEIEHNSAHTALGDCRATLELYKFLLK